MAIPTWTDSEVLPAADVNEWFVSKVAVKLADQSVTSSADLVDDNELFVSVSANAVYFMTVHVLYVAGAGHLKWGWTFPAGAVLEHVVKGYWSVADTSELVPCDATNPNPSFSGSGASLCNWAGTGTLKTSSTSGTLHAQFAQLAVNAAATVVKAQSMLTLQRIS